MAAVGHVAPAPYHYPVSSLKAEAMGKQKRNGKCEGCGNFPRVLTKIQSGQWVCHTCLREIRGPTQHFVSAEAVASLRRKGFNVPDKLTREEYRRLADEHTRQWQIAEVRSVGMSVRDDAPLDEVERLWRVARLRRKGITISDGATLDEVKKAESLGRGVWYFFSKVAGVTHTNKDGSDRQEIISLCDPLETLDLDREEDNPVDPNAIALRRMDGDQLGYLQAQLAADVVERLRKGYRYAAYFAGVTGGQEDKPTLGANLLILVAEPGVSDEVVVESFNRVIATDERLLDGLGAESLEAVLRKED